MKDILNIRSDGWGVAIFLRKIKMSAELRSPVRSPVRSPTKKQWDASAVGTDNYLASLTRRLELLEKKLVGKRGLRDGYPPLYPAIKVR